LAGFHLGAQEVIGMAASGAKYGIATSHFYWLGAIPAMVFVGIIVLALTLVLNIIFF
jgi:SSS family solute:Na+ symporter